MIDSGTMVAAIVGGMSVNFVVQSVMGAFRHAQTVARLEAKLEGVDKRLDNVDSSIARLEQSIRDNREESSKPLRKHRSADG